MNARTLLALALVPSIAPVAKAQVGDGWFADVILRAPGKLGGCAVGDVDPDHPGAEVAAVCETGQVFLSRVTRGRWVTEAIATLPGEPIQCAIGDALPDRPGDEILVVGMLSGREDDGGKGAAHLISRVDGAWQTERVLEDGALLHAGCIADVDPAPGAEVVVAGFTRRARFLSREDGGWRELANFRLPGPAKSAIAFAGGVAVACSDGSLVHLAHGAAPRVLDEVRAGQSRLGVAGERLVVARDDGKLALVTATGERQEIHAEEGKLRGAVLADLDPARPGLEAATAGYGRTVTVLYEEDGAWVPKVVASDDDRFHHLAVGEIDAQSPGPELVACGYSGRLLLIGLERRTE